MRHPQAFSEQKLQLVAEALAPMAQVRALVREGVLEELFPGEVLEIRIVDPAIAHLLSDRVKMCLRSNSPITKRLSMPGRPCSL